MAHIKIIYPGLPLLRPSGGSDQIVTDEAKPGSVRDDELELTFGGG
jgi:hypothetical protein